MGETKFVPGPWELDSAKIEPRGGDEARYQIIHGQLPKGINGDFGYPVCDTMNRHHCISPEEDAANGHLIAAAPEMLKALEELECYDCQHLMKYHVDKYGCEVERGDREGYEGEPAHAMGPCGCQCLDTPDMLNLIAAIRKARGIA